MIPPWKKNSIVRSGRPPPAAAPHWCLRPTAVAADLSKDVTEAELSKLFSAFGQVMGVRIPRDAVTHSSLGYAYVNYFDTASAAQAMHARASRELLRAEHLIATGATHEQHHHVFEACAGAYSSDRQATDHRPPTNKPTHHSPHP